MQRASKTSALILFAIFLLLPKAHSESVTKFVTKEENIREQMITISRELGVTCTECHNVQNFRDSSKKSFKVGKEHMKLTQMLKENGFDGKKGPMSTCYMCHRGKLMPDYKEPANNKPH
ncbi:photosynthetic reaction center cytochrome c subunit family protein [Bdellovibrio sp. 22V]|uniref:photosynthetic reaction center cytochrome c subunit family protein n=1 Tax=Bdellovibrio TaxID=958 RepID=UPI0025437EFF|nr:photosynthetic reaction center cytochrome c subunit family protein [Bdellovibrio sp. 22V]WII73621.1 photosynthetic reaction center cytochrome c subunit family protein [Bdellovibrio sp. 22V]